MGDGQRMYFLTLLVVGGYGNLLGFENVLRDGDYDRKFPLIGCGVDVWSLRSFGASARQARVVGFFYLRFEKRRTKRRQAAALQKVAEDFRGR
mgnify:CR=1 FL=1